MSKRVLVTGGNGQVATEYQMALPTSDHEFFFLDRNALDIVKLKKIEKVFSEFAPDVVVNLAAYTNVEKAEKEETSKAFDANAMGPKNLAIECARREIPLIHVSTDYVFDGKNEEFYTEKDVENPINHYGRTKFLGEKFIQEEHDWFYILRTSWVYSNYSKNFFTSMLSLAQERSELNIIEDQYGSPTSAKEICRAIDKILENLDKSKSGVYHFSGTGKTNWADFAIEIFRQASVGIKVNRISSISWPSKVERPVNSYMSSRKFSETFEYTPMHWKNALREVISERKIVPIKVGDTVILEENEHVIISTDWLKRTARISSIENMENSMEVPFEILTLR